MARPIRNNVDYFPFLCKEGPTMHVIVNKHGNDGYASWIRILRELAVTDYHFLDLSNEAKKMFLASKCLVTEEKLFLIINDLVALGEFNKQLWNENSILYSEKFVANIRDAYKKRSNECVDITKLQDILSEYGIRPLHKPIREEKQAVQLDIETAGAAPLIKKETMRDMFFKDLPNSEALMIVSNATGESLENLKAMIPEFNKYANIEYPNFGKFVDHFKNWVLKRKKSGSISNPERATSIVIPGSKRRK